MTWFLSKVKNPSAILSRIRDFPEEYKMVLEIFNSPVFSELTEGAAEWIEIAAIFVEVVAVIIILYALIFGTIRFIVFTFQRKMTSTERFIQYKHGLARVLLLSLEILVAADVIRTVALEPTLRNILGLGLLVVIRTFLSWSLVVEMEGHWPWQSKTSSE
jgi:uncharacterized membrane protein